MTAAQLLEALNNPAERERMRAAGAKALAYLAARKEVAKRKRAVRLKRYRDFRERQKTGTVRPGGQGWRKHANKSQATQPHAST